MKLFCYTIFKMLIRQCFQDEKETGVQLKLCLKHGFENIEANIFILRCIHTNLSILRKSF